MARHARPGHIDSRVQPVTADPVLESQIRAAVINRLGIARFGLWFGDSVRLGLSTDGGALEVRVPNSFFREWIRDHHSVSLLEAAATVVGRPLQLSIQVNEEGDLALPPEEPKVQDHGALPSETARPATDVPDLDDLPSSPKVSAATATEPCALRPGNRDRFPHIDTPPYNTPSAPCVQTRLTSGVVRRALRRLDDFVTGPGNYLAHAAATEMAETAGVIFNPLVIHGAVGMGKTHLLEGITQALRDIHPRLNILQFTAESFTNSFLESMRTGTLSGFRTRYRGAGGLIVDDVHFLAAKRATQDEFLHTFNTLLDKGVPIVLASDQHPRLIARLSDELTTRFLGGMVVKIEPPDVGTRRAILQARATAKKVVLPEAVLTYIAENLRSSVRELDGALQTVVAQAALTNKRIDLDLTKSALRDTVRHTVQSIGLRDVEQAVCRLFQVDSESLKSESRVRAVAYPRMLAMYLARKHVGLAYAEIGRYFGGRNHATVISAENKVQAWLRAEESNALLPGFETVADLLADLERSLKV